MSEFKTPRETILFLLFLLSACTAICSACSCVPSTGLHAFCKYDFIFRGRALAECKEDDARKWIYIVRVDQAFLTPENPQNCTIMLRTYTSSSMCGTRLPLNVDSIFYAHTDFNGQVMTSQCDPNMPWDRLDQSTKQFMTERIADYCAS